MESDPVDANGPALPAYHCANDDLRQADLGDEPRMDIIVVFTDEAGTRAALQMAYALSRKLRAYIRLFVPYEVPYTLPLHKPGVAVEFLAGQIRDLISTVSFGIEGHLHLCRDKRRALRLLLTPHSLVVVGGKKRWWQTSAQEIERSLRDDGHQVIFAQLR